MSVRAFFARRAQAVATIVTMNATSNATTDDVDIRVVRGAAIAPWLEAVAALRMSVFGDWPYLYTGDMAYERDYLAAYARSPDSVFVLAHDGDRVVGASTGIPLDDEDAAFQAPFRAHGSDVAAVFYFGESVLLPGYRGRGLGHAFFDRREAHARSLGRFATTAFCAVDREHDDPRRPSGHRTHDAFWRKRGYARQPGMTMRLRWNESGRGDVEHALTFWTRALEPAPA
jgi:GNAT superfamily N-acetyltransferase